MAAKHALEPLRAYRSQLTLTEGRQALQIEQLVARIDHQHRTQRVFQQHTLDALGRRNAGFVRAGAHGHGQTAQQLLHQQGSGRRLVGRDDGALVHGYIRIRNGRLQGVSTAPGFSQGPSVVKMSHLTILLAMAQPARQQRRDVLRPARQQLLRRFAHRR